MPSTFIMKKQLAALLPPPEMSACVDTFTPGISLGIFHPQTEGSGMGRIRQRWDERGEYTVTYLVRCWRFSYKSESGSIFSFPSFFWHASCVCTLLHGLGGRAQLPSASGLMLPSLSYSNMLFPGSSQKTAVSWLIIYLSWSTSYLQHKVRIGISC